jgi:hypothetical protein
MNPFVRRPESTSVFGWLAFHCAQVVTVEGKKGSCLPFMGPRSALPVTCTQSDCVFRSYMTNEFS